MVVECRYEEDVLAAVGTGRWPDRVDAELRDHVARCAVCHDLATVTGAFAADAAVERDLGGRGRAVPDASLLWWRAQLRARGEAARLAARPITVAQTLSFASIVGLIGVIIGATSSWLQTGIRWLGSLAAWLDPRSFSVPASVVTAAADHTMLVATIGIGVLLIPVGLYLAIREPRV